MSLVSKILLIILLLVSDFLLPIPSASAATLTRPPNNLGLVGYWPMDEGVGSVVGDASGNGRHGTLIKNSSGTDYPLWQNGKKGKALYFSGGGVLEGPYVNVPIPAMSAVSAFAWYKLDSVVQTADNTVFRMSNGDFGLLVNKGDTAERFHIENYNVVVINNQIPEADEGWHHIGLTYDGTTLSAYFDGSLVTTTSSTTPYTIQSGTLRIGTRNDVYLEHFQGLIDDVRVYNRALAASEIGSLYKSGNVKRKTVSNQGLVGYWSFNEGVGAQAGDSSGNGNTGAITGATWADGKKGKALSFDGSANNIAMGSVGVTTSYTASAWIKPNTLAGSGDHDLYGFTILASAANGAGYPLWLAARGSEVRFWAFESTPSIGGWRETSGAGLSAGNWYHIVAIATKSGASKVYVNGVEKLSFTNDGDVNWSNIFTVGDLRPGRLIVFDGAIDDVRVYNRALSPEEIQTLYKQNETKINTSQNDKLTSGLVGMYSFNGPDIDSTYAYDRSGNARNSALTGNPKKTIGKVGQALEFDGTSNYTKASGFSELGTSNQNYSFVGWVKVGAGGASGNIIHMSSLGSGSGWCLPPVGLSSGKLRGYSWPTNSVLGTTVLEEGVWYHFANTWDATKGLTIYVNGVLENSSPQATYLASGASNYIWIAFSPGGCAGNLGYFNGLVDEVRIYNRALSADEVKKLYNMGK